RSRWSAPSLRTSGRLTPSITRQHRIECPGLPAGVSSACRRYDAGRFATPVQVAPAWLLARKPWIVPIPCTTKLRCLDENLGAVSIELTAADLKTIDEALAKISLEGERLPEPALKMMGR